MSRSRDIADGSSRDAGEVVPHIIPGTLYPAISGKLLDGSTSHSGNYGTEQSDGREYYYTDIKGSKPINDPRIGGHFGSQRHKFKSLQLLEQETATHGKNVYTIDGREWARAVDAESGALSMGNSTNGVSLNVASDKEAWIEIVGYFNAVNLIMRVMANRKSVTPYINGVAGSTQNPSEASVTTPLDGRYVDSGSLASLTLPSTSLGINTLLIKDNDDSSQYTNYYHGIELIAQDTTSTANRSKIQIPSQDVVSYGKKFTVSGTPHYDPFNGFTSGSSVSSYIDTDTSLGVEKWKNSSTYYRPYNGGRVVRWVDSSGTIKTSVTLMPPNAKSIADSSSLTNATAKANASASNDTFYPTFEAHTTDVNEDNLHEVAKTFHWREFGNGSANGGTGSTSYPDASMLADTPFDIAYVMDDGLTSLSGNDVEWNTTSNSLLGYNNTTNYWYLTFIGTGITVKSSYWGGSADTIAQNLPYGTHILKMVREDSSGATGSPNITIDGVAINDVNIGSYGNAVEVTFHQCKRPPIPEDACVLADYMLMADFVPATVHGYNIISKGVRFLDASRDIFYNDSGSITLQHFYNNSSYGQTGGFRAYGNGTAKSYKLPVFGSGCAFRYQSHTDRVDNATMKVDGSAYGSSHSEYVSGNRFDVTNTSAWDTSSNDGTFDTRFSTNGTNAEERLGIKDLTIGNRVFEASDTTSGHYLTISGMEIISPIHTSFHYTDGNKTNPQTGFQTPFLNELVGGDRNLEQHTLICTPDGRTWDSLTRDTSYLSQTKVSVQIDHDSSSGNIIFDEWRGQNDTGLNAFNKNFAIGYDRLICLEAGMYQLNVIFSASGSGSAMGISIYVNGNQTSAQFADHESGERSSVAYSAVLTLKRDDYVQINNSGTVEGTNPEYNQFSIVKL